MSNAPKVIDLFSGVGGLSLSAIKAGFNVVGAVEQEQRILDSHAKNFPKTNHLCEDVSSLTGKKLRESIKLNSSELAGLIGGPPCQGFSTIGKMDIKDKRNNLFSSFFQLTSELNPAFFLAENVPGILNPQYDQILKKAFKIVSSDYQILKPITVCAKDLGAPTSRTRVFFIGIRKDIKGLDNLQLALNLLSSDKKTYVNEALIGLPKKVSDDWLDYDSSWRKIYLSTSSQYLKSLNEFIDDVGDYKAIQRFEKKNEVSGCFGTKHSKEIMKRYKELEPGKQDKISKSQKLNPKGFCPTLRAGTDSTKGSYQAVRPIHPTESRVITPREAARLQGFPDWFQFHETKWHSFRQIGNSVCPVAGQKVLAAIKSSIKI